MAVQQLLLFLAVSLAGLVQKKDIVFIDFQPDVVVCDEGQTVEVKALPYRRNGQIDKAVTVKFFSKNTKVASVTSTGKRTARVMCALDGQTYVGSAVDDKRDSSITTVKKCSAATLVVTPDSSNLVSAGDKDTLTAVLTNACSRVDSTTQLMWVSRNSAVASVAAIGPRQGMVTAVGVGRTAVVALVGSLKDSTFICVDAIGSVSPKTMVVSSGSTGNLSVADCNGPVAGAVTWLSRNTGIATVTTGTATTTVTGVGAGNTYVVASWAGTDSAAVTVVTPPPAADSGVTYFLADGESGVVIPPWNFRGSRPGADCSTNPCPSNSTTRAKNGSRSFKFEITAPGTDGHSTYLHTYAPPTAMPGGNGRYGTGYYSGWYWIDAGFGATGGGANGWTWNMVLGWMAASAISGAPDPISHIGFEVWNGVLQVIYQLKNCEVGNYSCPAIAGYNQEGGNGGWYLQTASSPNGITPLPTGQWVHLAVYYKMARTNGEVKIWQDGVLIYNLTAPTMNTMDGHVTMTNPTSNMILQVNIYEGLKTGTQRYYLDDFRVSSQRIVP